MRPISDLTPQEIICALEERVTPETWTIGSLARDAEGTMVDVDDPTACRFCELGHVFRYIWEETGVLVANTMSVPVRLGQENVIQTLDILDEVASRSYSYLDRKFFHFDGWNMDEGGDLPWVDPYFVWKVNDHGSFTVVQELNQQACKLAQEKANESASG